MELNDYQLDAAKFSRYPDGPIYPTLGLVGEAGEVADKVKKVFRDKEGYFDEDVRRALAYELGDVLWYLARLAGTINYSLEEVALMNIQKLTDRQERGVLGGSGDTR